MAVEGGNVIDLSYKASASLASNQFYAVRSSAENVIALCVGASGGINRALGILQNDPGANEAGTVRVLGLSKWVASAAIAHNAPLACTTAGTAVTAATTGEFVVGFAQSASTAAGQVFTAWINPGFMFAASTA